MHNSMHVYFHLMYVYICFLMFSYIYICIIYIHIHIIMKTVCPPSYHHNNFVATHSLGQPYIMFPSVYMYICMYICIYCICIYIYVYSVVSWPAVHEHTAADVFHYKRNFVSHYYICGYYHV